MHRQTRFPKLLRIAPAVSILFLLAAACLAATDLSPGDVAIVGFNADGGDDFSFVTLADIEGGTQFSFTDIEGAITYTAPGGGLPFGSVVVVFDAALTSIAASTGSAARTSGSYNFSGDGDELEVKQGTNYIYAAETRTTYAPPAGSGLTTEDATWVSHVNFVDNGRYTGGRVGTRLQLLQSIADLDNWEYADGTGDQSLDLNADPYNGPFSALPAVYFTTPLLRTTENAGTATLAAALDRAPITNTLVRFTTVFDSAAPGQDYIHTNGIITWPAGNASTQNIAVALLDNAATDGPRAFNVFLFQPELCKVEGPALAGITILDDDVEMPAVSNEGATNIAARSALLTGSVAPLDAFAQAWICWGAADGGTNRAAWSNIVELGTVEGDFGATVRELLPGATYRYRCAASNLAGFAWAPGTASFTTLAAQNYYVNDSSLADDVYCTAAGNDGTNDGRSPGAPKASIQAILTAYDLGPGDMIYVDTGVYGLTSTINITAADTGAEGNPVTIRGSTAAAGSVINRNNTSFDVISVNVAGDCYLRLEKLRVKGGMHGMYIAGTALNYCRGVQIADCDVFENNNSFYSKGAAFMQYCTDLSVAGCRSYDNAVPAGLSFRNCANALVVSNLCYANSGAFAIELKYCADSTLLGNIARDHFYGISAMDGENCTYRENTCHGNLFYGIDLYNCTASMVTDNISYSNAMHGIRVWWDGVSNPDTAAGPVITGNRIFDNDENGIEDNARGSGHRLANNLVYGNAGYNARFGATGPRIVFENNTLYGGKGVYYAKPGAGTNRHNILWASGTNNTAIWVQTMPDDPAAFFSDNNNLYATDGANVGRWPLPDGLPAATLGEWQSDSWKDGASISADPLFADADNFDFHITSSGGSFHGGLWQGDDTTSPCLDAGDGRSDFSGEPSFNGLRVNLGAHGNTTEASRTLDIGPFYSLTLEVEPEGTGTIDIWPPAPAYPHGVEITATATATDPEFRWDRWEGHLSGANPTNVFVIIGDIVAQAVFVTSNANTYGIPESWLIGHGIPPTQEGAEMDNDEDGMLNWEEYYAGTIPTNELSVLALTDMQGAGGRFALVFMSVEGTTYRPQSTVTLTVPESWTNEAWSATHDGVLVDLPVEGNGDEISVYVATGGVTRCYRVRLEVGE